MKNIIFVLAALLIGLSSCKKEEEVEPQVNKDDLLCRTWQLDKEIKNGVENETMFDTDYKFNKDGTATAIVYFAQPYTFNIEWRWIDNKENIEIYVINSKSHILKQFENFSFPYFKLVKLGWDKVEIKKLTAQELVFEQLIGEDLYRMEFSEK
ncbi:MULTISPECIES: hypothetical protein [unclassified Lentimicrobium]|uniref:hypothetical protein n=1 Tax=unclassified Lentimicrobium TaxID=2677434 RepID=UPI001552C733|nr:MULTISPECIES: hypothetical protein [unclassified Lentimicrobium]NPD46043.1 hypothetical protein [Lentimicrobium sp. S6]NPD84947.1 hypothetical protein [Lentimicrobium sp. L6]